MFPCHSQCRKQSPPWLFWKSSATDLNIVQPLSLHSARSSSYFALFLSLASPHLSSHGTVNLMTKIYLVRVDQSTMSGLRLVREFSFCSNFKQTLKLSLFSILTVSLWINLDFQSKKASWSWRLFIYCVFCMYTWINILKTQYFCLSTMYMYMYFS